MGMESYSITVLAKQVSIEYEKSYQKLAGSSLYKVLNVEKKMRDEGIQYIQSGKWIYNDCLELFIYQQNGKFQGIEIKGCLSWLNEGVKDCFNLVNTFQKWYGEFDIYILGQKVLCTSEEVLCQYVYNAYTEKIELFNRQYGNIKLKATCGKFYKEMDKQSKWYYKLFHKLK